MFKNSKQQQSGDFSTNVQAGKDVNITQYGISYQDAKDIALDVFKTNFYELAKGANEVAMHRAEEITNNFLNRLQNQGTDALDSMREPDMQYALFTAQKEYARVGDEDLADVLVDILVERSKVNERSLMQVVLNESLEVIPKITNSQLNILSMVFILKYSVNYSVVSIETLNRYLKNNIVPFTEEITKRSSYFQHLEYTGCASISIGESRFISLLKDRYGGIFLKGFEQAEIIKNLTELNLPLKLVVPSLHDSRLLQFNAMSEEYLKGILNDMNVDQKIILKTVDMYRSNLMSDEEAEVFLQSVCPETDKVIDYWNNSPMKNMNLTSVGIAIAHANIRRKVSEEYDLSIWI